MPNLSQHRFFWPRHETELFNTICELKLIQISPNFKLTMSDLPVHEKKVVVVESIEAEHEYCKIDYEENYM